MWHQQQSLTDPDHHTKLHVNQMASINEIRDAREQDGIGSISSATTNKELMDSGTCSIYDSGFLSESNLVSECLSDETSSTQQKISNSQVHSSLSHEEENDTFRLDSGVVLDDVPDEQFDRSIASLKTSSFNNLNASSTLPKIKDVNPVSNIAITRVTTTAGKPTISQTEKSDRHLSQDSTLKPWAMYFIQDEEGDTQLHVAVIQGFIKAAYFLISTVSHPRYLDIVNDCSQTPLHLAVITGEARIVRRLLVAGARVGVPDLRGNTALHLACASGNLGCLKALTEPVTKAEIGAARLPYTTRMQSPLKFLEARNYDGQMCIHLAAMGGHVDILRHLGWLGVNFNAREAKDGRTALHYAVQRNIPIVSRFILEECRHGPGGVLLETKTYAGYTAYQMATYTDSSLAQQLAKGVKLQTVETEDSDYDYEYDSDSSSDW